MSRKWLLTFVKFLVSGALIWFLLDKIDLAAAYERARGVAPLMLAAAIFINLVQIPICVFRWRAVLDAIKQGLSFMAALRIFMIGSFFNQTLPSSVGGDAVRMYAAYREGLTIGGAVNGVILERVATVVALVILVVATQPFFLPRIGEDAAAWIVPTLALFSVATVVGVGVLMVLDRLPASLGHLRVVRGLASVGVHSRQVFLSPKSAIKSLGWAFVGHVNVTFAAYLLALGLDLGISWIDFLALFPPVLLVTTLPISIAGWGVREGAMIAAFGLVGVPADGALVLSILFGLMAILINLPGGVIWLSSGMKQRDVELSTEANEAAPDPL